MKSAVTWFVVLVTVCIAGPYILHVRPRTHRDWAWLAVTIGFLGWMLLFMVSVRSR